MKYFILAGLLTCNSLLSMSWGLDKTLASIVLHGTLRDFERHEPEFRAHLSSYDLEFVRRIYCKEQLIAVEQAKIMRDNPPAKELVNIMRQHLKSLPRDRTPELYFNEMETKYSNEEEKKAACSKAIEIARSLFRGLVGQLVDNLNANLESEADPEKYLNDEQHKVITIERTIQNILDTEFEPQPAIMQDSFGNNFSCPLTRNRKKK